VADFSLEFLDAAAAGDDPLRAIDEYVDGITAADERRLGRAVRVLDRYSERQGACCSASDSPEAAIFAGDR
jgi:hypothetical protein